MYDSVLVPTDGSQQMDAVVDQAIDLASLCDATLHALQVVGDRAYYSVPADARDRVRETLREDAESFAKAVAERTLAVDLDVVREIRWGDPAVTIPSHAVENQTGCVVMGTHGRTGYERYLLGSVAEKFVRMAPMPVWPSPSAIRPSSGGRSRRGHPLQPRRRGDEPVPRPRPRPIPVPPGSTERPHRRDDGSRGQIPIGPIQGSS